MENPHEERQLLLLERIIKNVHLVNDALVEMTRSVAEINEFNKNVTIVGELWEGYRRNVAFNLSSMEEHDRDSMATQTAAADR
ncbi:DASH complex, subunit Dad4 [Meira miltonrushii]|uniref:DASH complex subunit DAD4 n=1 Tax=Meira miltonrushii TaxID=1280837 RepID=A0A316V9U0_9BASI|nr:DASH complex, subunit Dad4 [Meira miltonrushii]PWN34034.1 DASH complex, subunit Dad4 [Meira miltonrushii]